MSHQSKIDMDVKCNPMKLSIEDNDGADEPTLLTTADDEGMDSHASPESDFGPHGDKHTSIASAEVTSTSAPGNLLDLGNDDDYVWYFAIGAMLNPISMRNRKLFPLRSRAAVLMNHRINFFGSIGVAEAVPALGEHFHGVLHRVDRATMAKLDSIERDYIRRIATARCYDGNDIECVVYARAHHGDGCSDVGSPETRDAKRPHCGLLCGKQPRAPSPPVSTSEDKPPQQRYLDIMIMGCRHFGVAQEYIDFLETHESQPRAAPHEFRNYGNPAKDAPTLTLEEVNKGTGRDDQPLFLTFRSRVLKCTLDCNSKPFKEFVEVHSQVGHIGEMYVSKVAYDPKYGVPEGPADFTKEHCAYLEDLLIGYFEFSGLPDAWTPVAWFKQSYRTESTIAPSA